MEVREEPAEPRADDALERGGGLLDDRDLGAEAARGRGHLAADPARADDHEPAAVADGGAQGVGVGDRPQDVDASPSAPSIGGRRGTAPVAISSRSYASCSPPASVTRCAAASSAVARVDVRSSTSFAA